MGYDGFDPRAFLVALHLGDANRAHVGEHLTQIVSDVFKLFPKTSIYRAPLCMVLVVSPLYFCI